ncbi:uncharacterized protein LOC135461499 [Liolophura sinensis]|uniref:uncharacterized protein LOC135461499 n=1 Tax=Liolophura sinensis TaxID=3198878 RepID=UPI0031581443
MGKSNPENGANEKTPIMAPNQNKSVQEIDEAQEPHVTGGLTIFTAAVFMVGEMAGSGVLALPQSLDQAGWIGMLLIVGCCVLSAYTGKVLGSAWILVQERYPQYQGHVRYPYPAIGQVTYGKPGRYLVSFSINFTLFGVSTVFLLLAAENIQALIKDVGHDISFCYWLLLIATILLPVTWLGTPKDFWFIAIGATAATSVACVVLFSNMIYDGTHRKDAGPVRHSSSSFIDFFMAFGTICFAFGGHPAFPTFQTDMKKQKNFGRAVLLAYLIVLAMYLPVSVAGYFVYGSDVKANILLTVSHGPMLYIVQILITAHLLFGFVIVINPFCQEMEEVLNVPKKFNWKRCVVRTAMMALVVFVAETIPRFGGILALVGGSTTTLLAYVLPSLFYLKLCSMKGDWEEVHVPLHMKVMNYEILMVGVVAGIASTYSAITDLSAPGSFTLPCYINMTSAEGH